MPPKLRRLNHGVSCVMRSIDNKQPAPDPSAGSQRRIVVIGWRLTMHES
jgi:hypothetical protein